MVSLCEYSTRPLGNSLGWRYVNSVVPDVEVGEAPGVVHQVDGGEHQGELDGVIATSPKHCGE